MTETSHEFAANPWHRISLDPAIEVSLWVQLKTQLQYLITTGDVVAGTKLPPVRAFSTHLGVAIDTVRRAYEALQATGLAVTVHGVGSFTALPDDNRDGIERSASEWGRVDTALLEVANSGVDLVNGGRRFAQRLALLKHGANVVFIGVDTSAERYAKSISTLLGKPVRAVLLSELRSGVVDLDVTTYAIALVAHRSEVDSLLVNQPIRVLSLISKLKSGLVDSVPIAGPGRKLALVARPETRAIYMSMLLPDRPDLENVVFVEDSDDDSLRAHLDDCDAILHTSVATPMVKRVTRGTKHLIELEHVPDEQSLREIADILAADQQLQRNLQNAIAIAVG